MLKMQKLLNEKRLEPPKLVETNEIENMYINF